MKDVAARSRLGKMLSGTTQSKMQELYGSQGGELCLISFVSRLAPCTKPGGGNAVLMHAHQLVHASVKHAYDSDSEVWL